MSDFLTGAYCWPRLQLLLENPEESFRVKEVVTSEGKGSADDASKLKLLRQLFTKGMMLIFHFSESFSLSTQAT